MLRIRSLSLDDNYRIFVGIDDNRYIVINMKRKLHTARFSELRDLQVFLAGSSNGKSIQWPGGISLEISEILELVEPSGK